MKEKKRDETQRGYALIRILGLPMLVLLMLASVAGANPYAYITDSDDDKVSVIDTTTNTVTATVDVGDRPLGVTVTPDGSNVYVTNYGSNTVSVIDTATNTVTATVDVGDHPLGVAVTPDGSNVYVANYGDNTVSMIDTATNTVAATVDVGQSPWGVAVTPDGSNVYVTNIGSCSVSVIDTSMDTVVTTMEMGRSQPRGIAFTPDGSKAYMISSPGTEGSDAYVIDTATNTATYLDLGGMGEGPFGVAVTPDGSKVYITAGYTDTESDTLYVIDTATNNLITTVDVGDGPRGVAVTPDGSKVYAVSYDNMVSVVDTATNTVTTTVNVGNRPFALGQFICTIPAPFEIQITRITTSGSASNPHIYGDRIVWEDNRDGKNNIYTYDLSTKQETQISTSGTATYPAIYDNKIVWYDSRNGKCDVYMHDLSTKQETQVSTSGTAYASYPGPYVYTPAISGNRIVWEDYRNGQNIYMYDLSNSKETQITTSGSAFSPDIYGDRIVWVDGNDIYMGTVSEESKETVVSEIEVSDNLLREASPNKVYKSLTYIDIGGENSFRWRNVIRFNLSEYSSDTSIKNAALSLYWYYPEGSSRPEDTVIEVYRPASTWNPNYVSWNKRDKGIAWKNPGGDWYDKNGVLQGNSPYATITIKGSDIPNNRYYKLDVTDLVKEYTSGKYENTGFLIKARTESNNYIAFYSSDCGNESKEPKLQLVYS
ncbi:disaggregatase related repeat-containing protein [Methanosarcina sp. WWM596]|uniref:disaggregatase related repeat-containing protein n=1 Tax=Methanosarcina sp. WWM596 TaxID=1434103 RepID=UPI000615AA12|nr:disaggregatase related repeat-containing protein [Methanosarcina sp. WWM596]AKB19431.1 hypothetical protein MSWHS_2568 [Methanosarcina sp. WWM596]